MPQVVDTATGQPIDLPEGQIADAWKAGKIDLAAGSAFHVRMPDGSLHHVPAESLHTALGHGGQVLSPAELDARKAERDYGGPAGMAIAAGGGALEQGTLGLGGAILPGSWQTAIRQSEAAHPIAHAAGEIAGASGLSAVLPGGGMAGLAERGAAMVAGEAGTSVMARVAQRALVQAAKGAAEGAQYGASAGIAQSVLDPARHPMTAESILADTGAGALWGGGLGAGMGAIGGALRRGPLGDLRAPAPADVESVAGRAIGAEPQAGLGKAAKSLYARLAGAASGKDPEAIAKFTGGAFDEGSEAYANRRALIEADAAREAASKDVRSHLDSFLDAERALTSSTTGGGGALKRSNLGKLTADVDPVVASQDARNMVDVTLGHMQQMQMQPEVYGGEKAVASVVKFVSQKSKALDAAIDAGDASEQYAVLDELKRGIGKYTKGATALNPRAATDELVAMQGKARADKLQGVYEQLRTGLENEQVWGDAGRAQKSVNEAWTRQIDASSRFKRALTTEYARDPENPWVKKTIVDPEKVQGYLNALNNPAKDLTHQSVRDYLQSSRDFADAIGTQWELPPKHVAALEQLKSSAEATRKTLDTAGDNLALVNQFESLRGHMTGHASGWAAGLGAVGGHTLGGLPGGAAGLVLGKTLGHVGRMFAQPAETIMQLARIEGMVRRTESRIGRGIRSFVRGVRGPGVAPEVGQFARRAAQVREITADSATLQARVAAGTAQVSELHPGLGAHLAGTTTAGLAMLRARLPPEVPIDPLNPGAPTPPPPIAARESWMRTYRAVRDPLSVVEDLRDGRLPVEGVEVLRTVYPSLYGEVQHAASDALAAHKDEIDYQRQVALASLLGLPGPANDPAYVAARQAAYAPSAPPAPTQAKKSARKKPMNLTSQLSPSQRVEAGKQD